MAEEPRTDDNVNEPETAEADEPQTGPENEVSVEEVAPLRKKVTVTIPREKIDAKFDELFGELSHSAQIPGFRIGRAPRRLIEKRFGTEIQEDVRNGLIGEAVGGAMEKGEVKPLGEPQLNPDEFEVPDSGDMEVSFEVEVMPEFELPELEGIKVEQPEIEVTDEKLDETIDRQRQSQARQEPADEPAEEGDSVSADVKITGEDVEDVELTGQTVRVGPGQIEGLPLVELGDELKGKKAGDTVTVNITAPESHPHEQWQGKELTVELTIKQVFRQVLPDVEQIAESMGFDSVDEFREHVRSLLQSRTETEARRAMRDQVREYLLENTDFDLPAGVLKNYESRALRKRYMDLMNMGVPRQQIDENITRLQAGVAEQAQRDLKLLLIMNRIAEEKEIEVTEPEINAGIAQMAQMYDRRPERMRQELEREGGLSAVADSLRDDKVMDMLLDQAEVVEPEDKGESEESEEAEGEGDKKEARKSAKKSSKKSSKKSTKKSAKKSSKKSGKSSKKDEKDSE